MIDRRSFIGSILGTFVGSQLPFKVEEAKCNKITNRLDCHEACLRLFKIPLEQAYKCKIFAQSEGVKFWAPKLLNVKLFQSNELWSLTFVSDEIKVDEQFVYEGMGLVDDLGRLLKEKNFNSSVYCVNGDSLKITYTLEL